MQTLASPQRSRLVCSGQCPVKTVPRGVYISACRVLFLQKQENAAHAWHTWPPLRIGFLGDSSQGVAD